MFYNLQVIVTMYYCITTYHKVIIYYNLHHSNNVLLFNMNTLARGDLLVVKSPPKS